MRSTFLGYQAAQSALNYAQKAIDIVGTNIANEDDDSYTRQTVDAVSTYTGTSSTSLKGQGVTTEGVSQVRSAYLESQYRSQNSIASNYNTAATLLSSIQDAVGIGTDITSDGGSTDTEDTSTILGALENVYTCISDYCSDPTSATEASIVYTAFQNLTTVINSAYSALETARDSAISSTQTDVDSVNSILSQIANINKQMADQASQYDDGYYDNELMDARNSLLDELSDYCDVSVSENDDGTCEVSIGGQTVVSGEDYDTMYMSESSNGTISYSWFGSGESVSLSSGSLLANEEYINGNGDNATGEGESSVNGFLYYMNILNTLASSVADVANSTIPDSSSSTGYKTLIGAAQSDGTVDDTGTVTASNITVSDTWTTEGVSYFIYDTDSTDYSYAQQLAESLVSSDYTFTSNGETFTGTFEEFLINITNSIASDLSQQTNLGSTATTVAEDYLDARDQVEAVSQDEETSDLLAYQKLYEAAARVMTVMDELLDVIINSMAV